MFTPDGVFIDKNSEQGLLIQLGMKGPGSIERHGGYEDVYVKTADGWRFQSRVHVFPNLRESVQFGPRGRQGGAAATPAPAAK